MKKIILLSSTISVLMGCTKLSPLESKYCSKEQTIEKYCHRTIGCDEQIIVKCNVCPE